MPATVAQSIHITQWEEAGRKLIQLAQEFPEARYIFRPSDETRTFAETLRHVAFWNEFVAASARGEEPDGTQNELAAAKYPTKAKIIAALQRSIEEAAAALRKQKEDKAAELAIPFVIHTGEHYGQLAVYYRLNGLVPPASR
jgi:hypothetical protein